MQVFLFLNVDHLFFIPAGPGGVERYTIHLQGSRDAQNLDCAMQVRVCVCTLSMSVAALSHRNLVALEMMAASDNVPPTPTAPATTMVFVSDERDGIVLSHTECKRCVFDRRNNVIT